MRAILINPRSAAIASLIFCLPMAIILCLILPDIEPHFGPLGPALNTNDSRLGSIIVFGAVLLLPVALIASAAPIVCGVRAGKSILAHPINLIIAVALLIFMLMIVGGIIVDQYPCWIGVPNCD